MSSPLARITILIGLMAVLGINLMAPRSAQVPSAPPAAAPVVAGPHLIPVPPGR